MHRIAFLKRRASHQTRPNQSRGPFQVPIEDLRNWTRCSSDISNPRTFLWRGRQANACWRRITMLVAKAVLLQSSAGAVGRRELSQAGWDLRCRRISFRIFSSYVICWPEHVEVLQAVVVAESGPQNPIEPDQSDMKWYESFWIPSIGWKACAWVCCVQWLKPFPVLIAAATFLVWQGPTLATARAWTLWQLPCEVLRRLLVEFWWGKDVTF